MLEQAIKQATDGHKANEGIAEELLAASDVYQKDGRPWPTLVDGHVQVAIPGIIDRPSQVNYPGELNLNQDNQNTAWQDMQIGSEITYCPSPVYWPTPILAFAGLAGRSLAGEDMGEGRKSDLPGALLGFTEKDRQPVYVSPFASRYRHTPPAMLITGRTGSGKNLTLDTKVSMPPQPRWPHGGVATIGDLQVGDLLYADDGKAYPISYLSPIRSDDLYEIEFSDGQRLKAGGEHQWRVWDFTSRKRALGQAQGEPRPTGRHPRRRGGARPAQGRRRGRDMDGPRMLRGRGADTPKGRHRHGLPRAVGVRRHALHGAGAMRERRRVAGKRQGRAWPAGPLAEQVLDILEHPLKGDISPARAQRIALLRDAYESGLEGEIGLKELTDIMGGTKAARDMVKETLKRVTLKPSEADGENVILASVWRAADMLEGIARRIMWRYDEDGTEHYDAQIATTREMLEAGLTVNNGHANWAIPRPKPVEASTWTCRSTHGAWRMAGRRNRTMRPNHIGPDERRPGSCAPALQRSGLRGPRHLRRQDRHGHRIVAAAAGSGRTGEQAYPRGVLQRLRGAEARTGPRTAGPGRHHRPTHPRHRILPEPRPQTHRRRPRPPAALVGRHRPRAVPKPGRIPGRGRHVPSHAGPPAGHVHHRPARVLPATQEGAPAPGDARDGQLAVRQVHPPRAGRAPPLPVHRVAGPYVPGRRLHPHAQHARPPASGRAMGASAEPGRQEKHHPHRVLRPEAEFVRLRPVRQSMGGMLVRLDSPEAEGILDPVRASHGP